MKQTNQVFIALLSIVALIVGCTHLGLQKNKTPEPVEVAQTPDPADIINSPEFIAKHGYIVPGVAYPPPKTFTLKEKIDEADIVVEAKAVADREFNRTSADSVRTSYLLVVYKVFKGNVKTDTIELTVRGGFYEYIEPVEEYIPGFKNPFAGRKITDFARGKTFGLNEYGVFFLKKNPNPTEQSTFKQIPNKYKFVAQWYRNYLWYNDWHITEQSLKDTDPAWYYSEKNPLMRLYRDIQKITGKKYKERVPLYSKKKDQTGQANKQSDEQLVMTITGFSNDSVPAGTQTPLSHLTIYGSGFGTNVGQVHFKNATNGGANEVTISPKDILHWSNDSIQVHVPSMGDTLQLDRCAGSGVVEVVRYEGAAPIDSVTSTAGIIVPYSIKNIYARRNYFRPKLFSPHNGGYTISYDSSFYNNKPALAAFRRALQRWRCTTGINLKEYCVKARPFCDTIGQVGFIRVSFKKPCFNITGPTALGATVIKKNDYCINTDTTAYVLAQDLIFDNPPYAGFTWHYDSIPSAASNKYDFETTALHELGHVHLLDHLMNVSQNLYYGQPACNSPTGTLKTLSAEEIAAGNFIMGQDTIANALCPTYPPMQKIVDCVLPAVCPPSGTCSIEDPALFNQPLLTTTCPLPIPLVPTSTGLFGVLVSTTIGIAASHPYNAGYTYEWDFGEGAVVVSATTSSDYGPHEVQWETTGLKFVTLTVYNGDHCYGVAETF